MLHTAREWIKFHEDTRHTKITQRHQRWSSTLLADLLRDPAEKRTEGWWPRSLRPEIKEKWGDTPATYLRMEEESLFYWNNSVLPFMGKKEAQQLSSWRIQLPTPPIFLHSPCPNRITKITFPLGAGGLSHLFNKYLLIACYMPDTIPKNRSKVPIFVNPASWHMNKGGRKGNAK